MARVLLLIPSRTYRTHDFMAAASRLGIEVVVGSEHRPALAGLMEGRRLRLDFHVPACAILVAGHNLVAGHLAVDRTYLLITNPPVTCQSC